MAADSADIWPDPLMASALAVYALVKRYAVTSVNLFTLAVPIHYWPRRHLSPCWDMQGQVMDKIVRHRAAMALFLGVLIVLPLFQLWKKAQSIHFWLWLIYGPIFFG